MMLMQTVADWFHADLLTWTIRLVYVSAVGQTLFVLLWATLPWYRTAVGRALMSKSLALMLYLDWSVAVLRWGPFPQQDVTGVVLFGLITVGIWFQLGAIAHEWWCARRRRTAA